MMRPSFPERQPGDPVSLVGVQCRGRGQGAQARPASSEGRPRSLHHLSGWCLTWQPCSQGPSAHSGGNRLEPRHPRPMESPGIQAAAPLPAAAPLRAGEMLGPPLPSLQHWQVPQPVTSCARGRLLLLTQAWPGWEVAVARFPLRAGQGRGTRFRTSLHPRPPMILYLCTGLAGG